MRSAQPLALRRGLCSSCRRIRNHRLSSDALVRPGLQKSDRKQCRFKSYIAPTGGQARPIEGFYAGMQDSRIADPSS